jgi:hypothetical protein
MTRDWPWRSSILADKAIRNSHRTKSAVKTGPFLAYTLLCVAATKKEKKNPPDA